MTDEEILKVTDELYEVSELGVARGWIYHQLLRVRDRTRLETARACAEECEKERVDYASTKHPEDAAYNQAIGDCASAIRKRFGVET